MMLPTLHTQIAILRQLSSGRELNLIRILWVLAYWLAAFPENKILALISLQDTCLHILLSRKYLLSIHSYNEFGQIDIFVLQLQIHTRY